METRTFDEQVRLEASSDPAAVKGAELVLFCVKSMDTERPDRRSRRTSARTPWCCACRTGSTTPSACAPC